MTVRTAQSVYPVLRYDDPPAAMAWLEAVLGFHRHAVHLDEGGAVVHAELTFGEDVIMLGATRSDVPRGPVTVYLVVDEGIDERYAAVREAGAEVTMEISDQDYGSRDFGIRDPEGNHWAVGTYRPSGGT
jgi:uncharacterized glyoxalase superfamily protein PhnB